MEEIDKDTPITAEQIDNKEDLGSQASQSDDQTQEVDIPDDEQAIGAIQQDSKHQSQMINNVVIEESQKYHNRLQIMVFNFRQDELRTDPFFQKSQTIRNKLVDPLLISIRAAFQSRQAMLTNDKKTISTYTSKLKDQMKSFRQREIIFPGQKFVKVDKILKMNLNKKFASYISPLSLVSDQQIGKFAKCDFSGKQSGEDEKSHQVSGPDKKVLVNYPLRAIVAYTDMLLFLAMAQFRLHQYLKGAYHIRKAWKFAQSLYKLFRQIQQKEQQCNKQGINITSDLIAKSYINCMTGGFYYFISMAPNNLLWLLKGFGFVSNRALGEKLIRNALDLEVGRGYFAGIFVLWIETFLGEKQEITEQILQRLFKLVPKGVIYSYMAGHIYMNFKNIDKSIEYFKQAMELGSQSKLFSKLIVIQFGSCALIQERYQDCIKYLGGLMDEPVGRGWYIFQLALAYYFKGDKEQAMAAFKKSKQVVRKNYTWDEYAARKSAEFIKAGKMPDSQIVLFKAYNAMRCNDSERANKYLSEFQKVMDDEQPDNVVYYHFIKGKYHRCRKQSEDAQQSWFSAFGMKNQVKREKWLLPFSLLKKIKLWIKEKNGEKPVMISLIKEIERFKDYDFDRSMKRKVLRVKEQLKVLEENVQF